MVGFTFDCNFRTAWVLYEMEDTFYFVPFISQ